MKQNEEFFKQMDVLFEQKLHQDPVDKIVIVDKVTGKELEGIDYTRVLFDSNLNIYKISKEDGKVVPADPTKNIKAIIKKSS